MTDDSNDKGVLDDVVALVRTLVGDEAASCLSSLLNTPAGEVIAAPATLQAQIEDLLQRAASGLEESPENWGRLLDASSALRALRERAREIPERSQFLRTPVGVDVVDFLRSAKAVIGPEAFRECVACVAADLVSALHPAMAASVDRSVDIPFEQGARLVADALRCTAEGSYKDMLAVMAQLTYLMRGQATREVRSDLGALMAQCRDLWANGSGPTSVLHDPIRIVRNSESHRHTVIDVRAMTITFRNYPRAKPCEVLGPLDRTAFAEMVDQFHVRWLAMLHAFLAQDGC